MALPKSLRELSKTNLRVQGSRWPDVSPQPSGKSDYPIPLPRDNEPIGIDASKLG